MLNDVENIYEILKIIYEMMLISDEHFFDELRLYSEKGLKSGCRTP